ncbi:hypothetical protein A3Q56_06187 [Intoshia linei]|uniref:Uncharacterized protein n=1 Tax=Intoshia linei TaxID=1819745 RepID=A0A177AVT9_9BILA|nr:hypothetical protein A3Q56_06187 [Intoshia linei]
MSRHTSINSRRSSILITNSQRRWSRIYDNIDDRRISNVSVLSASENVISSERRGSTLSVESRIGQSTSNINEQINMPGSDSEVNEEIIDSIRNEKLMVRAIPYMSLPMASIFFILNVIIPGSGTIACGISLFCCGTVRLGTEVHGGEGLVYEAFFINISIGIFQFLTVPMMEKHNEIKRHKRERELKLNTIAALKNSIKIPI